MNKLIYKGKQYEIMKINNDTFTLIQDKPYVDFNYFKRDFGNPNLYYYKALVINGEFYGFKLIEHE